MTFHQLQISVTEQVNLIMSLSLCNAALRRADPPSKESYRVSVKFAVFVLILNLHQTIEPNQSEVEGEEIVTNKAF
jgi:hypothetical protein